MSVLTGYQGDFSLRPKPPVSKERVRLNKNYRVNFEREFSILLNYRPVADEAYIDLVRKVMYKWLVFEDMYYPEQFQELQNAVKFELWKE